VGKDIGLLLAGREEAARRALFIKAEGRGRGGEGRARGRRQGQSSNQELLDHIRPEVRPERVALFSLALSLFSIAPPRDLTLYGR